MSTSLKRTVTYPPKKAYKKAKPSTKMSVGLRRYLDVRGTPTGTYEIVRTVSSSFTFGSSGMNIGAASYTAGTFVFTPNDVTLYSGVAGNSATTNIPNASEIAALWDKIKIDRVECMFTTSLNGGSNTTVVTPVFFFVEDDNDTATSVDAIKQMDCKAWNCGDQNNPFKCTVRPKYQRVVYYTSLLSSYEPTRGYVVSGTSIPHYGLKIGLDTLSIGAGTVQYIFRIFFKCKELK